MPEFSNLKDSAIALGVIAITVAVLAMVMGSIAQQDTSLPLTTNHAVVNETITFTANGTNYSFALGSTLRPVISVVNPITNGSHNLYTTGNFSNNATYIFMLFAHLAGEPREGLAYNVSYTYQTTDYGYVYNATNNGIAAIGTYSTYLNVIATVMVGVFILGLLALGFSRLGGTKQEGV